jgi:hypothetical protein
MESREITANIDMYLCWIFNLNRNAGRKFAKNSEIIPADFEDVHDVREDDLNVLTSNDCPEKKKKTTIHKFFLMKSPIQMSTLPSTFKERTQSNDSVQHRKQQNAEHYLLTIYSTVKPVKKGHP